MNVDEITLDLGEGIFCFQDYIHKLSNVSERYKLCMTISSNAVIKSTGMILLSSDPIDLNDIQRVFHASKPVTNSNQYLLASTKSHFTIDDIFQFDCMPIGLSGHKLEVKVEYFEISKVFFYQVHLASIAHGKQLIDWHIDVLHDN